MAEYTDSKYIAPPASLASLTAPTLPYQPRNPKSYSPPIGLIGCGGITKDHLKAYRAAGYDVAALCDLQIERAEARRQEFYPEADVYTDHHQLLKRDDIEVVDIALHPEIRSPIVRDALLAGKHVLSQKPFVLDLDQGSELVELAAKRNVTLAVNQNGRWAPHFSYIREAVSAGLLGPVNSVQIGVHWDHNWVKATQFDKVKHLILFDFAIHWFDFVMSILGDAKPKRVFASMVRSPGQVAQPALLAQAVVEFPTAQASLLFNGDNRFGKHDQTVVTGESATAISSGVNHNIQEVKLYGAEGVAIPELHGRWFPDGFHGTMGELLCSIEENRPPTISAESNLKSLELCFAACASADRGEPVAPGAVRRVSDM